MNYLLEYFTLPKLTKADTDMIMLELRHDIESVWTPSKLVQTLDKHIIS